MIKKFGTSVFSIYLCIVMKKIIAYAIVELLIVGSFFCLTSCGSYTEKEYRCEIAYTIGGVEYSDVVTIKAPDGYVPVYAEGNGSIIIDIFPNGNPFIRTVVYNGKQDVRVNDFNYTLVRTYKASRWNGKEIKRRK